MKSFLRFLLAVSTLSGFAYARQAPEVHVLHVQGNVYMLVGAGGNVAVQVGRDGILMVDTGTAEMTDQLLAAVKQLAKPITSKPLRYIINTHVHPDHTGGNEKRAQWEEPSRAAMSPATSPMRPKARLFTRTTMCLRP